MNNIYNIYKFFNFWISLEKTIKIQRDAPLPDKSGTVAA